MPVGYLPGIMGKKKATKLYENGGGLSKYNMGNMPSNYSKNYRSMSLWAGEKGRRGKKSKGQKKKSNQVEKEKKRKREKGRLRRGKESLSNE